MFFNFNLTFIFIIYQFRPCILINIFMSKNFNNFGKKIEWEKGMNFGELNNKFNL